MKSSLALLSGVSAVLASPVINDREVDVVYNVVTNVVTEVEYYTVVVPAEPVTTSSSSSVPVVVVTVTASSTATPNVEVAAAVTTSSTSTTAAAASTASVGTDFESIALYHHNVHRANQSASDLTYDTTIAGYAATLAERCEFAHDV